MLDNLLGNGDDDEAPSESGGDDMDGGLFDDDGGGGDMMGSDDDLMGGDDDLMGGDDMGFDDMDDEDGATSAEMDNRIDELENEVASLSSTVNTVKSENELISESVGEVEENVRKLLEVYEMVTRGVNPFVDEGDMGDSLGGGGSGGGSMGLFGDESENEPEIDETVTEASADEFFDDDLEAEDMDNGGDDFDDLDDDFDDDFDGDGNDAFEDGDDSFDDVDDSFEDDFDDGFDDDLDDGLDTEDQSLDDDFEDGADSGEEGGKSFEELKAEYDSGEAEWDEEASSDSDEIEATEADQPDTAEAGETDTGEPVEAEFEGAMDPDIDGEPISEIEGEPNSETQGSMGSEIEGDSRSSPELESDVGETGVAKESVRQNSGQPNSQMDGGKPYLESLPAGYAVELVVMDWLEFLVEEAGVDGAARTIAYYESISWLDGTASESLRTFLNGFGEASESEPKPNSSLTVEHHHVSLQYISRIANPDIEMVPFDGRTERGRDISGPTRVGVNSDRSGVRADRLGTHHEIESDGGRELMGRNNPGTNLTETEAGSCQRDESVFDWSDDRTE